MYERITKNGEFNDSFENWDAGMSWSIVSGKAVWLGYTGGGSATLSQEIANLEEGADYEIWFSLSGIVWQGTGGRLTVKLAGHKVGDYAENGDYKAMIRVTSTSDIVEFIITPSDGATSQNMDKVELDNVSVVYKKKSLKLLSYQQYQAAGKNITRLSDSSSYQGSSNRDR